MGLRQTVIHHRIIAQDMDGLVIIQQNTLQQEQSQFLRQQHQLILASITNTMVFHHLQQLVCQHPVPEHLPH